MTKKVYMIHDMRLPERISGNYLLLKYTFQCLSFVYSNLKPITYDSKKDNLEVKYL